MSQNMALNDNEQQMTQRFRKFVPRDGGGEHSKQPPLPGARTATARASRALLLQRAAGRYLYVYIYIYMYVYI